MGTPSSGTATNLTGTAAGLTAGNVAPSFESSETTIGAAGTTTIVAHGLGTVPRLIYVALRCKTAELGYSIGDEVAWLGSTTNQSVYADATNIGIVTNSADNFFIQNRSTFASSGITLGNWKYVVRAYK